MSQLSPKFSVGRRFLASTGLGLLIALSAAQPAAAQAGRINFDIQSTQLADALRAYGKAASVQIIFDESLVRGRTAPKVSGSLTAAAALDQLLQGTGLVARTAPGGAIMVVADSAPDQEAAAPEPIVVTGSRVVRDGARAPTPTTIIGKVELETSVPANTADFVNSLPAVKASSTGATKSGGVSSGSAGLAGINLRSLGIGRTLVLINGQRSVVSAGTGEVDINTVPQALIERIDVVTGGASSVYGSDAVGGVVNFILDTDYTGVKGTAEYGETTYGDNQNYKFNLTVGKPFADGRGHILLSGEWVGNAGIDSIDRDWNGKRRFAAQNSASAIAAGGPTYIVSENMGPTTYAPGGLITAGPLRGTYFGNNGAVNQLAYGELLASPWMVGGDYAVTGDGVFDSNSLLPRERRQSYFGRVSFEVAPDINVYGQASYARYWGRSNYMQPTQTGLVVQADNAYLPQAVKDQMVDLGLSSFTMGTSNADLPRISSEMTRKVQRYVIGADGKFNVGSLGFDWDVYYQRGVTNTNEQLLDVWNNSRLALAGDAVFAPGTSDIVCRSTLTNPGNGCVPLNRLGVGVADPAALAYVLGDPLRTQRFTQDVAAVNFSTNSIEGWAGPISLAFGGEWRKETMNGAVESQYAAGWKVGNFLVTSGDYEVKEAYLETLVPLLKGLDFNGAVRLTDYSTSGGVTTWKAGLTWQPIQDIRARATFSRDIRAPNLNELHAAGTSRSNNVSIGGETLPYVQLLQGNPRLNPETADAHSFGVVFTPSFLPGFSASVDYYNIKVSGVIAAMTAEQTVQYCYDSNVQYYCDNIKFVNGTLSNIDLYYENLNSLKSRGIDFEFSYHTDLERLAPWARGNLSVRGLVSHFLNNTIVDRASAVNMAGSNLGSPSNTGSTPDFSYRISALYELDAWKFNLTARGVSSGVISKAYIECQTACPTVAAPQYTINDNHIDGATYLDLYMARKFRVGGGDVEFYFNVENLLNSDPSYVADPTQRAADNTPAFVTTNRNLYDVLGRTFRLGARFQF